MMGATRGKLGSPIAAIHWLFEPSGKVSETARAFLLGQLLSAPAAVIMGAVCAVMVVAVALLRTGSPIYAVLIGLELVLVSLRLLEWRHRRKCLRQDPNLVSTVDKSVLLSFLWCALQGTSAFILMSGDDPVLRVLSATLVMALIGPICARNYAAPRFAFLLILLCDLPFVAGALASGEAWLAIIAVITPPFLFGAMQIISTFHQAMLMTLAAEAKNLHLAQHDSLTGILNRHGMDAALSQLVPQQQRKMALISIDLDGFKQVNDSLGHGAGDLLLIQVAERIQAALGDDPLIGRMGGDEFMVVMRDTSPAQVVPIVDDLIAAISHRPYELSNGTTTRVGASIGFACLPEDAGTTVELRLRADQALYAAKERGKGVGIRYGERTGAEGYSESGAGEMKAPFIKLDPRRSSR